MQVRDIVNASLILAMRLAARAAPMQNTIGRLGASGPRGGWGMRLARRPSAITFCHIRRSASLPLRDD